MSEMSDFKVLEGTKEIKKMFSFSTHQFKGLFN